MKLKIGANIKTFRKTQNITQEKLAEILGVSCQSVSRWELGTCYPDMELLPMLAETFHVSVDTLLGVDDLIEQEKVKNYLTRFQDAISIGNIRECISITREGVAEYPNNFALLNKLMYALFLSGDEEGNIPEWKENMEKYDAEIVALGTRIMKYCPDQNIRLEATARLAFHHCEMGRKTIGRALIETIPEQKHCRESQMWKVLEEDELFDFFQKKLREDYNNTVTDIRMLTSAQHFSEQDAITATEKLFALEDLIYDGNVPQNTWYYTKLYYETARLYARIDDEDKMYEYLKLSAKSAVAFDNRPDTEIYSSLLLGEIICNRNYYETTDTRPLREILRDKWLSNEDFDSFRTQDEFQSILQFLHTGTL